MPTSTASGTIDVVDVVSKNTVIIENLPTVIVDSDLPSLQYKTLWGEDSDLIEWWFVHGENTNAAD